MKRRVYKKGDLVRYIPTHAKGNVRHPDCEDGVVTSQNERYVFVRFVTNGKVKEWAGRWRTLANSEACRPEDLELICRPMKGNE